MNEMNNVEMARIISSLVQLDINAVYACDQAIESTDLIPMRGQFLKLRDMHSQHVDALSKVVRALGVIPPEYSQDFKGVLMEGLTAIRGGSIEGTIKAMRTNEEHVARKYREAAALPFTPHIAELVEKCYRDVQSSLEFLDKMLANRIWEKAA